MDKKRNRWYKRLTDMLCYLVIALSVAALMWAAWLSFIAKDRERRQEQPDTEYVVQKSSTETEVPVELRMMSAEEEQTTPTVIVFEERTTVSVEVQSKARWNATAVDDSVSDSSEDIIAAVSVQEPVEDWYIENIPLDKQLQKAVFDAACENGVDYFTALGLIRVESDFQVDTVNPVSGCRGLCQLNPVYFPGDYTPEENVRAGMEYIGQLISVYHGDVQAALRAYNRGYDDGDRVYSAAVLSAAEDIAQQAGVVFP